ncbi:malate dehydrogenase [Arcobacter sp. YIC-310]|uniref:malate dehydrogenase n=1 Tax=Arcobacter sp. YIC-310 TaxID=3376632 RepID=UPI003C19E780
MAKSKKTIIDLKNMNLSYEERNYKIKLQSFKTSSMTLDVQIYEKNQFLKNDTIVFAHLPKKLKAKLNPLF